MRVKNPNDKSMLTERQWARKGYVKNHPDSGKKKWTTKDRYVLYLSKEEVHKATTEELKTYWHPERQRQVEQRKALEALRKAEKERKRQETEQYMERLKQQISVLEKTAVQLIRQVRLASDNLAEVIVLDLETTGLDCSCDEILQVSIISGTGETLYNSYIKPIYAQSWKGAESVNHISPEMVANAPTIYQEMPKINSILMNAKKIIGYNHLDFDIPFLKANGAVIPEDVEIIDIMLKFAPIYGEYSEYFGDYKWQKLITCAKYYHYDWGNDKAHDSLADCHATLFCYQVMKDERATVINVQ